MKVLIYLRENRLSPRGGPAATGFYIHQEVKAKGNDWIEFLKSDEKLVQKENVLKKHLYKHPFLTKVVRSLRHICQYHRMLYHPDRKSYSLFEKYDMVHFHTTTDLYMQRKDLENYKGRVLLTSHSPVPMAQELLDASATGFERRYIMKRAEKFEEMDHWAFERADTIIFPCPEAEEPYYNNWPSYSKIKEKKKDCYRYAAIGITKQIPITGREEIRKRFSIKENDFLISYVGRHNVVKGYDKLKKIGEIVLSMTEDICFVIAGKEGPLTRLIHKKWMEVGWTTEPQSYIHASDIFVLPNKETYFDVVMLEVLSLGKIVVASRTGGNKYFERIGAKGIFLYNTVEEASDLILKIKNMPETERQELEKENLKLYQSKFTSEAFYDRYVKMLDNLYTETLGNETS